MEHAPIDNDEDDYNFDSCLEFYESEIEPHFGFLISDYGFRLSPVSKKKHPLFFEEFICFHKGDLCIVVMIGLWCLSSVSVGLSKGDYCQPQVHLDTLIRRRSRHRLKNRRRGDILDLNMYAEFLKEECQDLLRGDVDGIRK